MIKRQFDYVKTTLPWLGQEHGATDHAVCAVESVDGAPAITDCCRRGAPVAREKPS
ncbi:putative transposase [Pseudomonas putida ND6]|uniref:Putative transposase n=1 Tax=Pseudomonas putida ND6 TaxID=231023 RepID=I3UNU9_PSEPU|nr:putative transposase [Pseudomonas putida ND6]